MAWIATSIGMLKECLALALLNISIIMLTIIISYRQDITLFNDLLRKSMAYGMNTDSNEGFERLLEHAAKTMEVNPSMTSRENLKEIVRNFNDETYMELIIGDRVILRNANSSHRPEYDFLFEPVSIDKPRF